MSSFLIFSQLRLFPNGGGGACAFLAFSLAASVVYIVNDIRDADADRLHPIKCGRPIASGAIDPKVAMVVASVFLALSVVLSVAFSVEPLIATAIVLCYLLINMAYSFGLKNHPLVDVSIVAIGFLLRILYGGAFGGIEVSPWLFLTVTSFSFYLALGKRRGEMKEVGTGSRKSLEKYTISFLDGSMHVFLSCTLVFYSLWATSQSKAQPFFEIFFFVSILLVMFVCMRYSFLVDATPSDGDPVGVLLADKGLLILAAAWLLCMLIPLYGVPAL